MTSAFVDNIPLTTMMIKIAISLGSNPTLQLPLQPLMWALSFGACLGGAYFWKYTNCRNAALKIL